MQAESQELEVEAAISQGWARVYREAKLRKRGRAPHGRTNQRLRHARLRRRWLFIGAVAGTIAVFVLCLAMLQ